MFDTVVVTDYDLARRQFLYQFLTELNYRVITVPSTQELLECLKQERPRCVVVAVGATGGAEDFLLTLRRLRTLDPQLKVVALVPPGQLQTLTATAPVADPRLTLISAESDQRSLIQTLLGALKEREMERVDDQASFHGHILLIEDEPRIAKLFSDYLTQRGYKVTAVANGEEALLHMQLAKPRVIILDILLPGMDGLLTLQQLKTRDPSVTVIVSSGSEDEALMKQAKVLGACAYLVKPFNLAKLEAAILTSTLSRPI